MATQPIFPVKVAGVLWQYVVVVGISEGPLVGVEVGRGEVVFVVAAPAITDEAGKADVLRRLGAGLNCLVPLVFENARAAPTRGIGRPTEVLGEEQLRGRDTAGEVAVLAGLIVALTPTDGVVLSA